MNERNDFSAITERNVPESTADILIRSVKETETKLKKENKLVRLQIGTAIVMTTCPEKYEHLKS